MNAQLWLTNNNKSRKDADKYFLSN